jgi:hypothetical protein
VRTLIDRINADFANFVSYFSWKFFHFHI